MQIPTVRYSELSDDILVDYCKAGEHRAFEVLISRWQESTYRLAWRYLASVDESMDMVQNTFIKAWTHLHKLDNPAKFGSWVHQICRNQCLDHLRSPQYKRMLVITSSTSSQMQTDEEVPSSIYDTNIDMDTPYTKMVQNQRTQMVHKALNSLPEEQKIIVMLKELEGLKFREIAELLQLPENTVKSRLYYGLTALRKYFSHFNLEQEVKSA